METTTEPTDSRAGQFLSSTFILLAFSWIVYACRIYTRVHIVRHIWLEDYLITVGMAALTVFAAMVPVQTVHGGGQHLVNITDPEYNIPRWGLAFFIAEVMYLITLWGVKLSVVFLLLRFSASSALSWTLRMVGAVITAVTIAFVLWMTFQCQPVQSQWNPYIPGVCASRDSYVASVYVLSAISAVTDIITAAAPIFILRSLSIDTRTKWYAAVTMGLGSLACLATLVRFKFIRDFSISEDVTYAMVPLCICSFLEVSLGCICASLATLRPFLQSLGIGKSAFQVGGGADGSQFGTTYSYESAQLHKGWEMVNHKEVTETDRTISEP